MGADPKKRKVPAAQAAKRTKSASAPKQRVPGGPQKLEKQGTRESRPSPEQIVRRALNEGLSWIEAALQEIGPTAEPGSVEVRALRAAQTHLMGLTFLQNGNPGDALLSFREAGELYSALRMPEQAEAVSAFADYALAVIEAQRGNLPKSEELMASAEKRFRESARRDPSVVGLADRLMAEYLFLSGTVQLQALDFAGADSSLAKASRTAEKVSKVAEGSGDPDQAHFWMGNARYYRAHHAFFKLMYDFSRFDFEGVNRGRELKASATDAIREIAQMKTKVAHSERIADISRLYLQMGEAYWALADAINNRLTGTGQVTPESLRDIEDQLRAIPDSIAELGPGLVRSISSLKAMVANLKELFRKADDHPIFDSPKQVEHAEVFVAMPFREPFDSLYSKHIATAVEGLNLTVHRADEAKGAGAIMNEVWSRIRGAKLVVAVVTGANPNVFYEIGLAHALGRPVVLLQQAGDRAPFDLAHLRILPYDAAQVSKSPNLFRQQLQEAIRQSLSLESAGASTSGR